MFNQQCHKWPVGGDGILYMYVVLPITWEWCDIIQQNLCQKHHEDSFSMNRPYTHVCGHIHLVSKYVTPVSSLSLKKVKWNWNTKQTRTRVRGPMIVLQYYHVIEYCDELQHQWSKSLFDEHQSLVLPTGLKGAPGPAGETRFVFIKGNRGSQGLPGINGFPGPRGQITVSECNVKQKVIEWCPIATCCQGSLSSVAGVGSSWFSSSRVFSCHIQLSWLVAFSVYFSFLLLCILWWLALCFYDASSWALSEPLQAKTLNRQKVIFCGLFCTRYCFSWCVSGKAPVS